MSKIKTGEVLKNITIGILNEILSLSESTLIISAGRKELYGVLMGRRELNWSVERICRNLQSLKQRKYIEIKKSADGDSIIFTNRAKIKMADKLANIAVSKGEYLFVSFDIPEQYKTQRDCFRSVIKRLGFRQIQKSLWVINKDVVNIVEIAAQEYKIEGYVVYILGDKTNINSTIESMLLTDDYMK